MLVAQFGLGGKPVFDVSTVFATTPNIQLIRAKLNLIPCGYILIQIGHDSLLPGVCSYRKFRRPFMLLQYCEYCTGSSTAIVARQNVTYLAHLVIAVSCPIGDQGQLPRRSNCKGPPGAIVCSHSVKDRVANREWLINCREHSLMTPKFNPVNHVISTDRLCSSEFLGRRVQHFDLGVARPEGLEPPTLCLEGAQYTILSAASGVAYEGTRHLSRS